MNWNEAVLWTYDRELNVCWAEFITEFIDILNPFVVVCQAIGRDAKHLDVTCCKIRSTACNLP